MCTCYFCKQEILETCIAEPLGDCKFNYFHVQCVVKYVATGHPLEHPHFADKEEHLYIDSIDNML